MNGVNGAFKFLCYVSINSTLKGVIGNNIEYIENMYKCSIDTFKYSNDDNGMQSRATVIRELSECLSGDMHIENWSFKEVSSFIEFVSCY